MSQVGVEPTMFQMSQSYSLLSSPLDILTHIKCLLISEWCDDVHFQQHNELSDLSWPEFNRHQAVSCRATFCSATRPYKLFSSWWDSRTVAFGMRILHRQRTQFNQACYIDHWPALWRLAIPDGGPGWNRTSDTGIFSPLLYRLSYRTIFTLPFYATTMILAGGTSPLHRTRNSRHNFEASGVRTLHLWWTVAASTFPLLSYRSI